MKDLDLINTLMTILTDLGIPHDRLHPEARLHQDLQLDSTEIVEISLALKRQLDVRVKLESRQDMTLSQVCDQIKNSQLSNANSTHGD